MPRTRAGARQTLNLPGHDRLILVSGGGWGVGDLEGAILAALSGEDTLVVCITGHNEAVRERLGQQFGDDPRVRVLGFTDQMSDWMAAADALVHSTAGLTVLEAHIRGCPVVSYGFSAGHLRANNAAFERFGLAEVAGSDHELELALRHITRGRRAPDSSFASLPSITSRALGARPRVRPRPVWKLRLDRVATAVGAAAVSVALVVGATQAVDWDTPYRMVGKVAKPLESRVHLGKEREAPAPVRAPQGQRISNLGP